jgi:hypothetical protein
VAHQVQEGNRSFGGHRLNRTPSGENGVTQHRDAPVAQLGQKPLDRIGEPDASFLPQQQPGDAGNGLGHGCDGEQRVKRHRRASIRAEMANGFVKNQAPMPGDRDDRAGQLADFDRGIQRGDDPGEPRGGHADRLRHRARQSVFVHRGCGHIAPPGFAGVQPRNPQ